MVVVADPRPQSAPDGSVASRQVAKVTLDRSELDRLWSPEYLERLARTYWRYLAKISLGALRVLYGESHRDVVLIARPLVLLRFSAPEYELTPRRGTVTWRIQRGLLVAPAGRGRGYLRISVERPAEPAAGPDEGPADAGEATAIVRSEVASFYPMIAGWGWFSRVGRLLYRATQFRIHVLVTNGFLRSLATLDLAPSLVGALATRPHRRPEG